MSKEENVIDALETYWTPSEIIENLKDFNTDKIIIYALEKEICIECCGKLNVYTWNEPRGEHFGFPSTEKMFKYICEECGETY